MPRQPRHPDEVSHMASDGCGYEGVEGGFISLPTWADTCRNPAFPYPLLVQNVAMRC